MADAQTLIDNRFEALEEKVSRLEDVIRLQAEALRAQQKAMNLSKDLIIKLTKRVDNADSGRGMVRH